MGQYEILDIFKRNNHRWLTAKEVKKKLDCNLNAVNRCLKNLSEKRMLAERIRKIKFSNRCKEYKVG